ncbi:MAG: GDSL-type esterase/lipase family protein [Verrucomicrobiota bacterium]
MEKLPMSLWIFFGLALLQTGLGDEPDAAQPQPVADGGWIRKFEKQKSELGAPIDLLFVGDSLTELWAHTGKPVWDLEFNAFSAVNLGISGDRTEHILYRVQNSPIRESRPKVIVLLAGTNNLAKIPPDSPAETAAGLRSIVESLRRASSNSAMILISIPPNGRDPDSALRARVVETNKRLAEFSGQEGVRFLDIHDAFLDESSRWKPGLTLDGTHFSREGYDVLARQLRPLIDELFRQPEAEK